MGYVCYTDRFAGTLDGVGKRLDYLEELGVSYLHLMPLLEPRPGDSDGGYAVVDYGQVDPHARHHGRPGDARGRPSPARDGAVRRPRREPHRRRAPLGEGRSRRRPDLPRVLPHLPRPRDARPLRAHAARGLPRPGAGLVHPRRRGRLGLDDVQLLPVGPRLVEPGRPRGHARRRCSTSPTAASTSCASTPHPSSGSARAPTARTSPRSTAPAGAARLPRGRRTGGAVQGRGDRRAAPARAVPRRARPVPARVRPRLPQPADGAAVVVTGHARRAARPQRPGPDAAGTADDCMGHLPALPRRHRLGRLRRGRLGGRAGPARPPAVPQRLLRRHATTGRSRAGRCSRHNPRTGDAPHLGHGRRTVRARRSAWTTGDEREVDVAVPPAADALLRRLLLRRHPAALHGRRARRCRNDPGWADDPEHAGDNRWMHRPPMDWAAAERRTRPVDRRGPGLRRPRELARARSRTARPALRHRSPSCWTSGTTACWRVRRRHPRAGRWWRWRPSPTAPSGSTATQRCPACPPRRDSLSPTRTSELEEREVLLPAWGHAWVADD